MNDLPDSLKDAKDEKGEPMVKGGGSLTALADHRNTSG
jgi:F-type H+-transporting ATPase subunit alpha